MVSDGAGLQPPTPVAVGSAAVAATPAADGGAPPAAGPSLGYLPALDGVRALAVLGVMAFHGGIPFVPAGFLGVDAFFVLSGFLITNLLVADWRQRHTIGIRSFLGRRARRLLPALFLVLFFVVCYGTYAVPQGTYPDLRADVLSTLFYVANWHFIAAGANYFVQTGPVSPLTHTWSLAIEEQFYLVWPLVVLGVLKLFRGRLRPLLVVAVVGALGSATEMAVLDCRGASLTRLYYGTDTHAQSLLVGVVLAVALAMAPARRSPARPASDAPIGWAPAGRAARTGIALAGAAGFTTDALLWWRADYAGSFLWRGGFLLADLGTAAVLLSVVTLPRSRLAGVLSVAPLRFVGRISYGMYLWHFPLFLWIDAARTGLTGYPLFGLRLGVTLAVATASHYAIEQPIRRGTVLRRWRVWVGASAAAGGLVAFVVAITVGAGLASPASLSAPQSFRAGQQPGETPNTTTVMVLGDSTALTLGIDLSFAARAHNADVVDKGVLGCGVAEVSEVATAGSDDKVVAPCNPTAPADARWPALWEKWVSRYRPSVVAILAGRWEVSNVLWRGTWTNITHAAFAHYVRSQLERAVAIASSTGAHVDLLTAPCYTSPTQLATGAVPADTPHRLAIYNGIVQEVAGAAASATTLVGLDGLVCPDGRYRQTIGDVTVRAPDGVHFPYFTLQHPDAPDPDTLAEAKGFGQWLGRTLWPLLLGSPRSSFAGAALHRGTKGG